MSYGTFLPFTTVPLLPSNLSLLPANLVPGATISAKSSETAVYPAVNTQGLPISFPWWTTGVSSEYIEFDLGSAQAISLIALINHNLTSGATITVKAGASSNPSTFTSVMTWRAFDGYIYLNSPQTFRYWRIVFADAGNAAGHISVGSIMLGNATQLGFGFNYDWDWTDQLTNLERGTEFNVPHNSPLAYQVSSQHVFEELTDSQIATLRTLFLQSIKNIYPFFWIPDVGTFYDGYVNRFVTDFSRRMGKRRSVTLSFKEDSRGRSLML